MSKTRRARSPGLGNPQNQPKSADRAYPWRQRKRSGGPNFKRVRRYR